MLPSITQNANSSTSADSNITMNISSDSKWVVTADSTVTNLNVEEGGKIVDADGKTVTIVNNGKTIVEGTSAYTVTVEGTYSTEFTTDEDNTLSTEYIDRSGFDSTYNLSTIFNTNSTEATPSATTTSSSTTTEEKNNTLVYVGAGIATIVIVGAIAYFFLKKKK